MMYCDSSRRLLCNHLFRFALNKSNVLVPKMLQRSKSSIVSRICDPSRADDIAVINGDGNSFTYKEIVAISSAVARKIKHASIRSPAFIACYCPSSADYVVSMLTAWRLGACFVPLSPLHPKHELQYFVENTKSELIISSNKLVDEIQGLGVPFVGIDSCEEKKLIDCGETKDESPFFFSSYTENNADNGLVLFTSGTTGKPKGVLHSHSNLEHMVTSLVNAWEYDKNDRILHFLPLHHLHGVLNKLLCVLWVGGIVEFLPSAAPRDIWKRLQVSREPTHRPVTLFMAVPTVYAKLLERVRKMPSDDVTAALSNIQRMRLMASGSAALPAPVASSWTSLTGHVLLERYGMTEIGMALSNSYRGRRFLGEVGSPLPFVECRLVDEDGAEIPIDESGLHGESRSGEIRIRGPTVFVQYLNLPAETSASFDALGWFRTGDTAVRTSTGSYRILGRTSVDIIKSGGYKLSALEIERELLEHPEIAEAVVIALPNDLLGEVPLAIVVLRATDTDNNDELDLSDIRAFLAPRLAPYKHPRAVRMVEQIPRNALGKVNKKTLLKDLSPE